MKDSVIYMAKKDPNSNVYYEVSENEFNNKKDFAWLMKSLYMTVFLYMFFIIGGTILTTFLAPYIGVLGIICLMPIWFIPGTLHVIKYN